MNNAASTPYASGPARLAQTARRVVAVLGGRYSSGLGIDVDAGDAEVERWFLAATLFGTRIPARIAERTFGVLDGAGLHRVAQARHIPSDALVALLDEGGYVRYDFRTATRLQDLAEVISERYDSQIAVIGHAHRTYPQLRHALDVLPGWGPVTIQLFLRELRGVWPGAQPPMAERAAAAARHLGFPSPTPGQPDLRALAWLATTSGLDLRDVESGLVRLVLAHHRQMDSCPGGPGCTLLAAGHRQQQAS